MANVRIDRLDKEFRGPTGTVRALRELSLDIADGEFISLPGRLHLFRGASEDAAALR